MISRDFLRRNSVRLAAILVAAALLDGCTSLRASDEATVAQPVEIDKNQMAVVTNPNVTITGVAQNTRVNVKIYFTQCAGVKWPAKGGCIKRNKTISQTWKGPDEPMTEPSNNDAFKKGSEWAEKNAEVKNVPVVLTKGKTWSLANELKQLDIGRTEKNGDIISIFLYAEISVDSGTCDVQEVKPKELAAQQTLDAECAGEGRVELTFGPEPAPAPTPAEDVADETVTDVEVGVFTHEAF